MDTAVSPMAMRAGWGAGRRHPSGANADLTMTARRHHRPIALSRSRARVRGEGSVSTHHTNG